jgi:protein-S-isoprenylcysteine O-methyltransferase Ste14
MHPSEVCSTLWMIFGAIWLIAWLKTKPTQQRAPVGLRLRYGVPVLAASYLMFTDNPVFGGGGGRILPRNPALDALAIVLTAAGIAFAVWARSYLGGNWSGAVSVKVGHELIRTGPYAWVRHPIYSGLLVALFGTALARSRPVGFLAIALFLLGFWIKSRIEEEFMHKTFGEHYAEYARETGALIPKIRV